MRFLNKYHFAAFVPLLLLSCGDQEKRAELGAERIRSGVCPSIARVCKDGNMATAVGDGGCRISCPEDKIKFQNGGQCPGIGRVCQDGKQAVLKGGGSCDLVCPEDSAASSSN